MEKNAVKEAQSPQPAKVVTSWTFKKETIFTLLMVAISATAFLQSLTFPFGSGLYPMVISIICFGLVVGQTILELRQKVLAKDTMDVAIEDSERGKAAMRRALRWALWVLGLYLSIWLVGMRYAFPAFFFLFLWREGHFAWRRILLLTAIAAFLEFFVLTQILDMEWQRGLLQERLGYRF